MTISPHHGYAPAQMELMGDDVGLQGEAIQLNPLNSSAARFPAFSQANKAKYVKQKSECFIAGTLVHTQNGLVAIEKIKVGDMVLSQPEGKGPLSY